MATYIDVKHLPYSFNARYTSFQYFLRFSNIWTCETLNNNSIVVFANICEDRWRDTEDLSFLNKVHRIKILWCKIISLIYLLGLTAESIVVPNRLSSSETVVENFSGEGRWKRRGEKKDPSQERRHRQLQAILATKIPLRKFTWKQIFRLRSFVSLMLKACSCAKLIPNFEDMQSINEVKEN